MHSSINLALVGAGYWGKNLARVFNELGVLRVICDPSEEIIEGKSKMYPGVSVTPSFTDVLHQPDINAVAIATPAVHHFSMTRDALLAGKHVFVEKPLSLNTTEGKELTELAKKTKRVLFVGHILHYHSAIIKIKQMIAEGELGRLQYIYSNRLALGKFRREENILWSFAPHDISVILSLVHEEPDSVWAVGSNILHPNIADTTITHMKFPSGVSAHIFVSWLHPFKEQKLVIVGERKMITFDDTAPVDRKIVVYPHNILWREGIPIPEKKEGTAVDLSETWEEPLAAECQAFLKGLEGQPFHTTGEEAVRVLSVLQRCQQTLDRENSKNPSGDDIFVHETSTVDEECEIGTGTKIWHFSHILKNSVIGENCSIGQNVMIGPNTRIGNGVKIQNNVSVYEGVTLEDDVFCGPSCVFTNVINPRSAISRKHEFKATLVKKGATLGANATLLCGITIGKNAFIGAGAVVTRDVPDNGLVYGNPATLKGYVDDAGNRLDSPVE